MKLRPSHTAVTIGHDGEEGVCGYCGVLPTFLLLSLLPSLPSLLSPGSRVYPISSILPVSRGNSNDGRPVGAVRYILNQLDRLG